MIDEQLSIRCGSPGELVGPILDPYALNPAVYVFHFQSKNQKDQVLSYCSPEVVGSSLKGIL